MAEYDNSNRIAGWIRESATGKFISGVVNVEGKDYNFALFKNDQGDNPKKPNYTGKITLKDDVAATIPSSADEDVPF